MQGSLERVRAVIQGRMPDRAPLYELLRNDAVLAHFAGEPPTVENGPGVVFRAYAPAVDATRPLVRLPNAERTERLEDGREQRYFRWTIWTEHRQYPDTDSYIRAKRRLIDQADLSWNAEKQRSMDSFLESVAEHRRRLGEVFLFPGGYGVGLMSIYSEVGLEAFSYHLADCPDIIEELLELGTRETVSWVDHLPKGHGIEAIFLGDDIAYKTGPLLSPVWFQKHYFHRLARVLAAWHAHGIRVLFHSDGNLNSLLDGLVEAGIDGLNPLEVLAGMDIGEIHRRHPHLFLAGGIDVSELLPHGKPEEIRDAVKRGIDAAEGRLLVGSSTELHDAVPLENYLALRETVLEHRYG